MRKLTITLKNSGNFNDIRIEQDNRVENKKEEYYYKKHVDKDKSVNNIYWSGNTSIEKIYEDVFQEAYENYRQSLKKYNAERADSLKNTYYEQVKADQMEYEQKRKEMRKEGLSDAEINKELRAKPKLAYLTIIKLGDREGPFGIQNLTDNKILQIKRIMGEFMTVWQQKYPNMKLINVAVHLDEVGDDKKGGTVHMHITYCPMCDSYTKGQKVQNSMTGALKQMGYESDTEKDENGQCHLSIEKWQIDMRNLLESIINKHGYERSLKNKDNALEEKIIGAVENVNGIEEENNNQELNMEKDAKNQEEEIIEKTEEKFDEVEPELDNENIELSKENMLTDFTEVNSADVDFADMIEIENDKNLLYNGLKNAIKDGLQSLQKVNDFLNENRIDSENIGCDYTLELECLQEHFEAIVVLLEYYQKSHKELTKDVVMNFVNIFKKESMCINLKDEKPLYTVTEESLLGIINKALE